MSRKALHPTFQKKHVLRLDCKFCGNCVCMRGMKAILLADTHIELFSTDYPPNGAVDLINQSYCTEKCQCKIKDVACLGCGNVVGYTVVQPCKHCLQSCNNGHLWMYHSSAVEASERLDCAGCRILVWGRLEEDEASYSDLAMIEECCR